jgi:hypothetical protein
MEKGTEVQQANTDDKLLQGWEIVKDTVKRLQITEGQIRNWFAHYNIELSLADFEKAAPPTGVTSEMLSRFVDSLVAVVFHGELVSSSLTVLP